MAITPLSNPKFRAVDANGNPLANGSVEVFELGTTTEVTVWDDYEKTTVTSQPVSLDASGEALLYFEDTVSIRVKDSAGATLYTVDYINENGLSGTNSGSTTTGSNLITNGGFENVTGIEPDDWTLVGTAESETGSTNLVSGSYSLKLTGDVSASTAQSAWFAVTPSTYYNVYVWAKTALATDSVQADVFWFQSDQSTPSAVTASASIFASTGADAPIVFTKEELVATEAPSDAAYGYVLITQTTNGSVGYYDVAFAAEVDNYSFDTNDNPVIYDSTRNEILILKNNANAVNEITITNAATGNSPKIESTGDDANVGLDLASKGTGEIDITSGGVIDINATGAITVDGTDITVTPSGTTTLAGAIDVSGDMDITGTWDIGSTQVTSTAAELNVLDGINATLTTAEINVLDGITATTTELNAVDNSSKVRANYAGGGNATTGALTILPFDTEDFDTRVDFTTGAAAKFTPDIEGYFRVSATFGIVINPAVGDYVNLSIYKNAAEISRTSFEWETTGARIQTISITDLLSLDGAGDYIDVRYYISTASTPTIAIAALNNIAINRTI